MRAEQRLIVKPSSDIRAVKGDDVTLECAADGGRRSPRLTWKRRSGAALPHNRYSIQLGMCVPLSDCCHHVNVVVMEHTYIKSYLVPKS